MARKVYSRHWRWYCHSCDWQQALNRFPAKDTRKCPRCGKTARVRPVETHRSTTIQPMSDIEVASIQTTHYKEVIEIRVPVRFYWSPDGSFDGIEFGEFKTPLLSWQEDMVEQCLEAVTLSTTREIEG